MNVARFIGLLGTFMIGFTLLGTNASAQGRTIKCESKYQRYQYCQVNTKKGVRLTRRLSHNACIEGRSWGYDRHGIWVDDGCRAVFALGDSDGWDNDDDWNRPGRPDNSLPNWAVGTFRGFNPDYNAELTLRIHANGKVVGHVQGRRINGTFDAINQEIVFPAVRLRVERERRGIRTTSPGYRNDVFYSRIK